MRKFFREFIAVSKELIFHEIYCRFVHNIEEVKAVISKLYENRKIANATHNMYAYRITESNGKSCIFDFFVKLSSVFMK